MDLQLLNPIGDPNWDDRLLSSAGHSFRHTSDWAKVLADSCGYKPIYFTAFENDQLSLLMPFMEISIPLTGKRGVSLPFTDYCNPFAPSKESLRDAVQAEIYYGRRSKWDYAEWWVTGDLFEGATASESYSTHDLDLERSESEILSGLRENVREISLKR